MALNFPSSPTTGDTYTDPNAVLWKYDGVKWSVVIGTTNRLFSGAKVYTDAPIYLTSTDVPIDWDVESFDVGNYFTTADATKLTVPDNAYYNVKTTIYAGPSGAGSSYTIKVRKNGTTILSSETIAANQAVTYDEIIELAAGDYIEILANESDNVGTLLVNSVIEIVRLGLTFGQGVSQGDSFSGIRTALSGAVSMTSTPTAIIWTTPAYDANANADGATYWDIGTPTRITFGSTGYFRLKGAIITSTAGSDNSYTFTIKKNITTTVTSVTMNANQTAIIDEIFTFSVGDYIELFASNSGAVGTATSSSFLEVSRVGV
jgi:hypothetical protein